MLTLIGTGHVFNLATPILKIFDDKNPDAICVELDQQRYNAMMIKQSDPEKYKSARKNLPIIYKMLARFQDNMADEYGVTAGDEMLTAINYAQSHQLPVLFIDVDAQNLFKKMLKSMSILEKFRLLFSGLSSLFISKKRVEKELTKFEGNFDEYIEQIGGKFPTIKKVLIDDRNNHMARLLTKINDEYEKPIAVLGDGHLPGIAKLLENNDISFETIRLSELRNQEQTPSDSNSASFTLEYKEI